MRFAAAGVLLAGPCLASPVINNDPGYANGDRTSLEYGAEFTRAQAVKDAFRTAWDGYYKYAFPNDELKPQTNSFGNSRNGWGASAVDALSTAIIMEYDDIVNIILDHVATIDWRVTSTSVSVFETTIRYLGGLLSGYDLLTGPFAHVGYDQQKVDVLLLQARNLADLLKPAFDTPSGIPDNIINITTGERLTTTETTGLAVAGTLVLEWTHLSDLTGDPSYGQLAQHAEQYLLRPEYTNGLSEPFPGLEGTNLHLNTGEFIDVAGGWNGGTDSFYEYLIKMYVYDPTAFCEYRDRWVAAADSTIRYLESNPSSRPDVTFVAAYNGTLIQSYSSHLAGFIGGNFLLRGTQLGVEEYTRAGLRYTSAWHDTYIFDTPRIGPELFRWIPADCLASGSPAVVAGDYDYEYGYEHEGVPKRSTPSDVPTNPLFVSKPNRDGQSGVARPVVSEDGMRFDPDSCVISSTLTNQTDFYAQSGFFVTASNYNLRPEVLESYYYAYRITGDPKYQEWAWDGFSAITRAARVGSGYSSFSGLNTGSIEYDDNQESFWFAETLKYAYLIFSGKGEFQVNARGDGVEKWVFNTEAHPFKVRAYTGYGQAYEHAYEGERGYGHEHGYGYGREW